MEKKSFKETNIEQTVKGLIELVNRFGGINPIGSQVLLEYDSEWDVVIGIKRKEKL